MPSSIRATSIFVRKNILLVLITLDRGIFCQTTYFQSRTTEIGLYTWKHEIITISGIYVHKIHVLLIGKGIQANVLMNFTRREHSSTPK